MDRERKTLQDQTTDRPCPKSNFQSQRGTDDSDFHLPNEAIRRYSLIFFSAAVGKSSQKCHQNLRIPATSTARFSQIVLSE
jgi:hypothetical protein